LNPRARVLCQPGGLQWGGAPVAGLAAGRASSRLCCRHVALPGFVAQRSRRI